MKFNGNMTLAQLQLEVGVVIAKEMEELLRGQTGELINGKLYFYSYDLEKAYNIVIGKEQKICEKTNCRNCKLNNDCGSRE